MYTMQDFIENKIVVKITSRDDMHDFLQMCENKGLTWRGGRRATAMFNKGMPKRVFITCGFAHNPNELTYSENDMIYRMVNWTTVPFSAFKSEMPEETIGVIKRKGDKVQIHIGDKHGSARCSPQDKFDLYTGCRLALDRAFGKEPEEAEKPKKPENVFEPGKRYKVSVDAWVKNNPGRIIPNWMVDHCGREVTVSDSNVAFCGKCFFVPNWCEEIN